MVNKEFGNYKVQGLIDKIDEIENNNNLDKDAKKTLSKPFVKELKNIFTYVAIDTETSCLNEQTGQLLQIGMVFLDNSKKIQEEIGFKLHRSERYKDGEWSDFAEKIHGIPANSLLIEDGKTVFNFEKIYSSSKLTPEEQHIKNVFRVMEITRPEFQAWNVTFDYKWIKKFLEDHDMDFEELFGYSPVDMKSYVKGFFHKKFLDLNSLKTDRPEIYSDESRFIDRNGNIKMSMSAVNHYFGGAGQVSEDGSEQDHDALDDIRKSVYNTVFLDTYLDNNMDFEKTKDIMRSKDLYSKDYRFKKFKVADDSTVKKNNKKKRQNMTN